MIMEFVPHTLQDVFADQSLQFCLPVIMAQILAALVHIHDHGVRHGDLKLENIFMSQTEDHWAAKLADFGASENIACSTAFAGTSWFMAPEMLKTPRQCDEKTDLFSLGMCMAMLLTGSRVWSERTSEYANQFPWTSQLQKDFMCQTVLPMLDEVGRGLSPLVYGLLCREPENRWSAKEALAWVSSYIDMERSYETNAESCRNNTRKRKRELHALRSRSVDSNASTIRFLSPGIPPGRLQSDQSVQENHEDADDTSSATFHTAKETPSEFASLSDLVPRHVGGFERESSIVARLVESIANPHHDPITASGTSLPDTLPWAPESAPTPAMPRPENGLGTDGLGADGSPLSPVASVSTPFTQDDDTAFGEDLNEDEDESKNERDIFVFNTTDWFSM